MISNSGARQILYALDIQPPSGFSVGKMLELAQAKINNMVAEINEEEKKIQGLAKRARSSKHPEVRLLAEAMLHECLGVSPKTKDLGYKIADDVSPFVQRLLREDKKPRPSTRKLVNAMLRQFDMDDYAFCRTHYDTCSNGHFYRMS